MHINEDIRPNTIPQIQKYDTNVNWIGRDSTLMRYNNKSHYQQSEITKLMLHFEIIHLWFGMGLHPLQNIKTAQSYLVPRCP